MAGLFTLSLKEPFPARIETIAPSFKIADENVSRVERVDRDEEIRQKISQQLILWSELTRFDRRQDFVKPTINERSVETLGLLRTAFVMHEAYLSNTVSWILPKPFLIDQLDQFKFYIGTQLGDIGTTVVCEHCKSAVKFYWPREEGEISEKIRAILASSTCPLCGKGIRESDEEIRIKGNMAKIMSKFKYKTGLDLE